MLRVVWVVPGFSADETDWCIPALLDFARILARRCVLNIVAMRYPYRRDTYSIGQAKVHSIGGAHRGFLYTPAIWLRTLRKVKSIECDLIHAFWAYEPGFIAALLSSRRPVVISLAGGEVVHLPGIQYGLGGKLRTRIPIRWALKRAGVVTAGSPFLLEKAKKMVSPEKLRHLPLGLDLTRWRFVPRRNGTPLVLNVGSLEPVKGQEILLRAFAEVLRQVPAARIRIIGEGPMLPVLRQTARELGVLERVQFAGSVPHHDLYAHYAGASLFAQASWHEAQGMAMLEAAACGLPIIGTGVGALPSLAPNAAIVVRPGDEQGLAEAMTRILREPAEAARLGKNAREQVESMYEIGDATDRFLDLYRSILSGRMEDAQSHGRLGVSAP